MFRATSVENACCEQQAKFVQERLVETEETISKLYLSFAFYIKKASRLRDATDDIALTLNDLGKSEEINGSSKKQILTFSNILATINDLRDSKIQQLQLLLVNHLSHYHSICHNIKEEIKNFLTAKEKEFCKRKQLGKLRNVAPFKREKIIKAEAALFIEASNISQAQKDLEQHAICLEKKKLEDIKTVLQEYVTLEITEHALALELLTQSYEKLNLIDSKSDLKDFEEVLKANVNPRKLIQHENNSLTQQESETENNKSRHQSPMSENEEIYSDETFENTSEDKTTF